MSSRNVILRCARTNGAYMASSPAGRATRAVARLYDRLAAQGVACASAWVEERACPPHEPAVDAFWWGVAAWSTLFCADVVRWGQATGRISTRAEGNLLHCELQEVFARPHREFAAWLRPLGPESPGAQFVARYSPKVQTGSAARLVLEHDAAWAWLVVRLTARWGLLRHLKDLPALWETLALVRRLRRWPDPVAGAYLGSDLQFFNELFSWFPLSPGARGFLDDFLGAARLEAAEQKGGIR